MSLDVSPERLAYALVAALAGGGAGLFSVSRTSAGRSRGSRAEPLKIEISLARIETENTNRNRNDAKLEGRVEALEKDVKELQRKVR